MAVADTRTVDRQRLRRRLRPLYVAVFLQNVSLWVPIEKLFMTSIGFDAAMIGVMAALYSLAVPVFEVPSGILADRWSRSGVLLIAAAALTVSVILGGFSTGVPMYLVAAMFLGVFFAMQSGTLDSVVYDTVLEETHDSGAFERTIGRVRFMESGALVAGALVGGALAEWLPLRATYFLTVPFVVAGGLALLAFREPRLHQSEGTEPLRRQIITTYRTLLERGRLRIVVTLTVLTSLLLQAMLEFGPLWLVAFAVPALLYGPHWAGLTAALGAGGLIGGWRGLTRTSTAVAAGLLMVGCCVTLVLSRSAAVVIVAQIVLTLVVVAVSIPTTRLLHDAVSSTIRAGVASGVGTLSWLTFLPFALVFGVVVDRQDVHVAGWILVGFAILAAVLTVAVLRQAPAARAASAGPTFAPERFLPPDDPHWPGHWARPPSSWDGIDAQLEGPEGLAEVRAAILDLPAELREVIVRRDVEGLTAAEVCAALGLTPDEERSRLHRARAQVRERLERFVEGTRP